MKYCSKCQQDKAVEEFYTSTQTSDGKCRWCKTCMKQAHQKHYQSPEGTSTRRAYHKRTSDKARTWHRHSLLRRKYKIDETQYNSMLQAQGGVCKICGTTNATGKRLAVDHDHNTGAVRGLLCHRCNLMLGIYEEYKTECEQYLAEYRS